MEERKKSGWENLDFEISDFKILEIFWGQKFSGPKISWSASFAGLKFLGREMLGTAVSWTLFGVFRNLAENFWSRNFQFWKFWGQKWLKMGNFWVKNGHFEPFLALFWGLTFIRWSFLAIFLGVKKWAKSEWWIFAVIRKNGISFLGSFFLKGLIWGLKWDPFSGKLENWGVPKVVNFRIFWNFQGISLVLEGENPGFSNFRKNPEIWKSGKFFWKFQKNFLGLKAHMWVVCPHRAGFEAKNGDFWG